MTSQDVCGFCDSEDCDNTCPQSERTKMPNIFMEYLNMDTISPATMEQLRLWDEYGKEAASPLDPAPPMTLPIRLALYELAHKLLAANGKLRT
jgi:hypothetical protein